VSSTAPSKYSTRAPGSDANPRPREIVGRPTVLVEQPPRVADQRHHRRDRSAGAGSKQQAHAAADPRRPQVLSGPPIGRTSMGQMWTGWSVAAYSR